MNIEKRCLEKVSKKVINSIVDSSHILREVENKDEKRKLIQLRTQCYQKNGIAEPKKGDKDPFDDYARFFVLENNKGRISKALRIVNRKKLGLFPIELNLKTSSELEEFSKEQGLNGYLKKSTLDENGKKNLRDLLKKYRCSDKLYEVGGFFGTNKSCISVLEIILGIGQIGFEEEWDLVVQTHHPKHANAYKLIGFPYRFIGGYNQNYRINRYSRKGFLDCCKRPAVIMALEGDEFRTRYNRIQQMCEELQESPRS